jgi:hypothetical protein
LETVKEKSRLAQEGERLAMRAITPRPVTGDRTHVLEDENDMLMHQNKAQQSELDRIRSELIQTTQSGTTFPPFA